MKRATSCRVIGVVCLAFALLSAPGVKSAPEEAWLDDYRERVSRIIAEALQGDSAWRRLAELTDTFGHRLSGSPSLADAIQWAVAQMTKDGLEHVRADSVMVPHWVRGEESAEVIKPARHPLVMLGLGNSIGTPAGGIEAEALVVRSFEELETRAAQVRGKILVFNQPFVHYTETVSYRSNGPSRAARHGAVATLVRSVGPGGLRTPHTGALSYADDAPKVPAAAITGEDADRLQRLQDRGVRIVIRLQMAAKMLPDAESANVIGELTGREKPEEIVVVSCHFDSWDVGTGATDDGGGCIAAWEVLRLLQKLHLRPRRTLRVVLYTNEENGLRGGLAYRDRYRNQLANHVLMIESDGGVFRPSGFGFSGSEAGRATVTRIASLLSGINADRIESTGGGADIGPSVQAANIPAMSLEVDGSQYFTIHHTAADTVDKISPSDMARCVAAMAVMSYVVADMPQRLAR